MVSIEKPNKRDFEEIIFCNDKDTGLKAIIALHDTTLGPATGGCRFYPYHSEEEALNDVLRLARGMTYKSAISRLAFGGGKSVIIGDPHKVKTEKLLERYGEFVESLKGRYITAKDVGINSDDLRIIYRKTKHILGVEGTPHSSGNPSPATAFGIMQGFKAIAKEVLNKNSLEGLHFAIQGVGSVGYYLIEDLYREGAQITICDIDREAIVHCSKKFNVEVVDTKKIYDVKCDFFTPCAMGGIINAETIPRLKCKIVAGAANNQLASPEDGYVLMKKGIFYAPDYVINAGGIINIAEEYRGYNKNRAYDHIAQIYQTMTEIIHRSEKEKEPPFVVANKIAEEIVLKAKQEKVKACAR